MAGVLLDEVALQSQSFVEQALARCSIEESKFWFNCNPEGPEHWFYKSWVEGGRPKERNVLHLHFTMDDYTGDLMDVAAEVALGTGDCIIKPYTDGRRLGVDIIKNKDFVVCESIGNDILGCIMKVGEFQDQHNTVYERFEAQMIRRAAMDGTANLSHTHMIGFRRGGRVVPLREYYLTAVDRAVTFVRTGTVDYQTAMRSTVRDMARSGLQRPIGTLNCHHFASPIILGVSKPVHSARELEEINARSNAPVEYRAP